MDETSSEHQARPGGPLVEKPMQNNGKWYYRGKEIPSDEAIDIAYSMDFWKEKNPKLKEDLRDSMLKNIESAYNDGQFSLFINPKGIDEEDKMKMSAYRVLALEFGYKIGKLKANEHHVATGEIEKTEK